MTTRKVTILYFIADDHLKYEVVLDDEALAELIIKADKLQEETQDRADG